MATGMADYAHKAATTGTIYLETISEYDLYCHYVAGLVGEGLSGIFSASGKEAPWLKDQLELSNSMGLLLQKTNIIRDYREDTDKFPVRAQTLNFAAHDLSHLPKDPWLRAMHVLHVGSCPDALPCREEVFAKVLRCVGGGQWRLRL